VDLPDAAVVVGPLVVQSGATLLVGLVMLLVGLAAGLLLRPLIPWPGAPDAVAQATAAPSGAGPALPTTTVDAAANATQAAAIMDAVMGQTRHFRGDPNAPVTLIEYSDFQ
jgi:hypothetical protein